jgi:hypothetical protein
MLPFGMAAQLLRSSLCTEESLQSPAFLAWADRIRAAWDHGHSGLPVLVHRKIWEWVFIIEALAERGQLAPDHRGLGFGVGQDPLVALFASEGCDVVATDIGHADLKDAGWVDSHQHASGLAQLNQDGICDPERFAQAVQFREVDMRHLPSDLGLGQFDFTWSACAFEHLGSLAAGREFILRQMDFLVPSGVAVHTTEFNVGSNSSTVGSGPTVLYRRRDIDDLVGQLRALGHLVEVDYAAGNTPADRHVDRPPWSSPHLKIALGRHVVTSLALIIEKGPAGTTTPWHPDGPWRRKRMADGVRFGAAFHAEAAYRRLRGVVAGRRGLGPPAE